MVVEQGDGDIERWISLHLSFVDNGSMSILEFDYQLASVLMMIAYTLYVLDDYFDGFVHGDLGPRNILYLENSSTQDIHYSLNFGNEQYDYYISPGIKFIPKLWDFDKACMNNLSDEYFEYLPEDQRQKPPCPFNEDLSILIAKIVELIGHRRSCMMPLFNEILSMKQMTNNRGICEFFLKDPLARSMIPSQPTSESGFTYSYP